jgi:hypothetical protein
MRISGNEKTEKLRSGFSRLDGREQEHILGISQALLFAALKAGKAVIPPGTASRNKEEK